MRWGAPGRCCPTTRRRNTPSFCSRTSAHETYGRNAAFAEQQLEIADNVSDDWSFNPDSGKLSVNKEAMLRSKLRIEARQFHMSRLHPQQWGEKQQIAIKDDWSLLTVEERGRKAYELIQPRASRTTDAAAAVGLPGRRSP